MQYPDELPEDGTTPEYACTGQGPQYIKVRSAFQRLWLRSVFVVDGWCNRTARFQPSIDSTSDTATIVQLGQPAANTKLLQICDSQDVRKPFKPLGLETDCWHRCSVTDRVSITARNWMKDIIAEVIDHLQETIRILWCVTAFLMSVAGSCASH